jgi:hypothetical protein
MTGTEVALPFSRTFVKSSYWMLNVEPDSYLRVLATMAPTAGFCHRLHFIVEWPSAYINARAMRGRISFTPCCKVLPCLLL